MKTKRQAPASRADAPVSRHDWVRMGLRMLAESGIDAVRVEPLAALLGVTKGSFYWHFADRAALHAAMRAEWRQSATRDIVAGVAKAASSATDQLHDLLAVTTSSRAGRRLEAAIRSWASMDDRAARFVAAVDKERIEFGATLLREMGVSRPTADVRARIVYLALIGSYFLADRSRGILDGEFWDELQALATAGSETARS
jgi:AcrR family transcriptional regulator